MASIHSQRGICFRGGFVQAAHHPLAQRVKAGRRTIDFHRALGNFTSTRSENVVYIFISFYSFGFVERDRGGEEAAQKAAVSTLRYRQPGDLLRERSLCPGTGANRGEQGVSEVPGQTIFGVS